MGLRSPPPRRVLHPRQRKPPTQSLGGRRYERARARGASHTHATRILGRAWSQIIWRLWRDHDTYDPHQHTALQRLIAAGG